MEKRIKFIDISRGFAILFIVLGHTIVHSEHCGMLYKFIYSFNVILFFIISGYLFKIKSNEKFLDFFKKKFLRMMLPYFIWEILFLIPYFLFAVDINNSLGNNGSFSILQIFLNIIIGNGNNSALKQNTSLWFLPALFMMEIVYYLIIKVLEKYNSKKCDIILFIILFFVGLSSSCIENNFIWGLKTVLNIGIFFYIGYLLKKYNMISNNSIIMNWYSIIILLLLGLVGFYFNGIVGYIDYIYGNYFLMFMSGFSISVLIIIISYRIKTSNILEYIGKNTMTILIFHKLIIVLFQSKLGKISEMLLMSNFIVEILIAIAIAIISIIFSLGIGKGIRMLAPILIGENKEK